MYAPKAFLQLGIAGHSWRLAYDDASLSLLLTKPCLCCSQRSCSQALEAFAFVGRDQGPPSPSAVIPSGSLFRAGPSPLWQLLI